MSWFPSANSPRPRSPNPNHGCLSASPSRQPSHHHQLDVYTSSTAPHGLPNIQAPSWQAGDPQGLGLFTHPGATKPVFDTFMTDLPQQKHMFMPFSWPSEYSIPQPPTLPSQPVRKDSWSTECCDPLSTLLPGALWDHLRPASSPAAAYDTSPGQSDYSTSSRPSAVSSPFGLSDIYVRPGDSPLVKVENLQDRAIPQIHFTHDSTQYEPLLSVNPEDLVAKPEVPIEERIKAYLGSSSSSDTGDYKPSLEVLEHRRAWSCEDFRAASPEQRRRRTLTRPENANFHCGQCDKVFQRSYNLKAHMDTHDPNRSKPHPCPHDGCSHAFHRRTDLVRHERCVSSHALEQFGNADGS